MLIDVNVLDAAFTASASNGKAQRIPPLTAKVDPAKVKAVLPFDYLRGIPPQLGGVPLAPLLTGYQLVMDHNFGVFISADQPQSVWDALSGKREVNFQL